jgi:hypothetical protein
VPCTWTGSIGETKTSTSQWQDMKSAQLCKCNDARTPLMKKT